MVVSNTINNEIPLIPENMIEAANGKFRNLAREFFQFEAKSSIEYLTSIKESIKLQLGIYSLLYQEKHAKTPDKVGVFFLKDKLYLLPVDQQLLQKAKDAIFIVHAQTTRTEKKEDYQKNITPLCKWRTGQCDFFAVCKPF